MKYVYTLVIDFHPEVGDPDQRFETLKAFVEKTNDPDTERILSFDYAHIDGEEQ